MLILPPSLLPYYSNFESVELDNLNFINAVLWNKKQPTRKILGFINAPDEINVDLGKVVDPIFKLLGLNAPEITTVWTSNQEDEVNSGINLAQATRERQFKEALKLQEKLLKRGKYRHNIAYSQSETE